MLSKDLDPEPGGYRSYPGCADLSILALVFPLRELMTCPSFSIFLCSGLTGGAMRCHIRNYVLPSGFLLILFQRCGV